MTFYKVENGICAEVDYAHCTTEKSKDLSVIVSINFDANPPLKNKQNWEYVVSYSTSGDFLKITSIRMLHGKPFIRKVFRLG
jgi:hypothetical protein